jgi:hypothetical protein
MVNAAKRGTGVLAGLLAALVTQRTDVVAQQPAVEVVILDHAQVPASALRHAREHVQRVFGAIGVEIEWRDLSRTSSRGRPPLSVLLLSPAMVARKALADSISEDALATSSFGATRAWIFWDRVCRVAEAARLDPAIALGRVIAHELGHLIEPNLGHTEASTMQPTLDTQTASVQRFTEAQGRAVRAALVRESHKRLTVHGVSDRQRSGEP